jgi:hypothetical protein
MLGDIWRSASRAQQLTGYPRWRQLTEIARLRLMPNKIKPAEYFGYRLFRPELSFDDKRSFIGSWTRDGVYAPNDPNDAKVADFKLSAYELFEREGLPHPRLRAVVNAKTRYPDCAQLSTADEIVAFFERAPYPLFVKPDRSHHGWGAKLIDGCEDGMLRLRDDTRISSAAIAAELLAPPVSKMLIQDAIAPHAAIARMTGGQAATGRALVLMIDGEPHLHSAVLRIPIGKSMIDNFQGGATGNMLAEIDVATGRCRSAVGGIGFNYKRLDRHPDTGQPIEGLTIPDWPAARDLLCRAARLFPGLAIQGWDIAFAEDGPSLLENNSKSEFRIIQHATQRGLIDPTFRRAARM